jgi:outer membrane immunogenic protein
VGFGGSIRKHVIGVAAVLLAAVLGGPAFAADLPAAPQVYAPPPAPPPPRFSWTGCYLGIDGGGAIGRAQSVAATSPRGVDIGLPITNPFNLSGGVFGGEVGCNYQISAVVVGVANDFSWTNLSGSGPDIPPFAVGATNTVSESWLDTLRGRVGFAWDRVLIYGTGGAAFANVGINVCGVAGICVSDSQVRTGWTAGAGVEWAAWSTPGGNLTFKIEYLHVDLGNSQLINPPVVIGTATFDGRNVRLTDDILRGGVNWKFDWW